MRIHFIGIGGIGMSALARYFLACPEASRGVQKWAISGSDSMRSRMTDSLIKEGVRVKIGHKKGNVSAGTDLVIYNRAIPKDNPELLAARAQGIKTLPYAEALGEITKQYTTIAITGSHGKSTTTALAGLALVKAGYDPTVLVGTILKEFGDKNVRIGKSKYLVLEADDYGAAFLDYSPVISIVTNIDREHMDFYKTFANVENAFLKFMAKTKEGGTLILNRDDKNLYSLKSRIANIAKQKNLRVIWYSIHWSNSNELDRMKKAMKIPGEHNLSNAMAVYELGKLLKIPQKKNLSAIGSYRGAWRRMEYRGICHLLHVICHVYDDYAHHPTEVKATLAGFRAKFPRSPLICVFQPHQAKRLELLFKDFVDSFSGADILVLLPSYQVVGRDTSSHSRLVEQGHTSEKLAQAIQKRYPKKEVYYLANPKKLKSFLTYHSPLTTHHSSSPLLLMMGAGNIVDYTDDLLN
jgi:UDP-N-acetylmuramate--alanine ligase